VSPALVTYVAIVTAVGGYILSGSVEAFLGIGWMAILAWIVVSLMAESLWLQTITGKAMESMASAVDLSVLVLLGYKPAVWIVAVAFALANVFFSKRVWYKAIFNAGQNVIALTAAGLAFSLLGGKPLVAEGGLSAVRGTTLIVPWVAATLVYFVANTLLVSGAVALQSGRKLWTTWKEEYLYYHSILGSAALFFLSPLVVVSYLAVGFFGLIFFFVPLLLIKEAGARYIALEKAQEQMVASERLAAKGEMAAEIAHEINNYLAAISGRAQLFLMNAANMTPERAQEGAKIIFEQARQMGILVRGLVDFSHKETRLQPTQLNEVIRRTIEFITPQNKYERVSFDLDVEAGLPEASLDPAQVQQVLLNLFSNAADALRQQGGADPRILVRTRFVGGESVELTVEDNGPGIPGDAIPKLFEPSFTTKPEGHGFGLATVYRIVKNHGGTITAENAPRSGARFVVHFPVRRAA
jgi:signal transduction histidine kinase